MGKRQYMIAAAALLVIWMFMSDRNRNVVSTAPGLSASFNPMIQAQAAMAKAISPDGLNIVGPPTISVAHIERVLSEYHSPAVGHGQEIYDLGIKYDINPAITLAFFIHESSAGTNPHWAGLKPDGSSTYNIGNIVCTPGYQCYGRFRDYGSWSEGIEDWYKLIKDLYVGEWGRTTVDQIIPKYAPASDNNDETAYINGVKQLVNQWQQEGQ